MSEQELFESFWLCTIKGIGRKSVMALMEEAGEVTKVRELSFEKAAVCIGEKKAALLQKALEEKERRNAQRHLMQILEKKIRLFPLWHEGYPQRLTTIPDPPVLLFVKGKLPGQEQRMAALIGARACSAYGAQMARYFAEQLSCAGVGIVSGMARGIDSIAQEMALRTGQTSVAVLGCGVDVCYPPENRRLYERLEQEGALVSEYLPGTQPQNYLFPPRNRIISGMADLVLVVEAREKSGTLITVDMALEQGREVFAVPGRVQDLCSRGCNRLIGNGAGIAHDADAVLEALGRIAQVPAEKKKTDVVKRPLTDVVLQALGSEALSLDLLAEKLGGRVTVSELMQELLLLTVDGTVFRQGNHYFAKL